MRNLGIHNFAMMQNISGKVEMTRTRDIFDTFWILWARYCKDRKLFRKLRGWLWPNIKLHTFTLADWDVKHEQTTVATHNGHLGPIVEHTHADPKGFYLAELLWRTSVALMCLGVTRYQSKLVHILKVKFGWGTHELGKAICFVTFCYVFLCLSCVGDVWLVLIIYLVK